MSDLNDLIRACKAEPDDDAPRLILADWLEEHGEQDRAAFIRHQTAARDERVSGHDVTADWSGEWRRWADAWQQKNEGWVYPVQLQRGFLRIGDYYRELYDDLLAMLNPPFEWTWVEEIRFGSWHDGDWSPLFQSPRVLDLNRLEFIDDHYRSNLLEPMLASPFVANLRHLRMVMVSTDEDGLGRLSQCSPLGRLRSLDLYALGIGRRRLWPEAAKSLATSELWDQLRSFGFEGTYMGDAGIVTFATGRHRPKLEHLRLSDGAYTDAGLRELARSDRFPSLRALEVGYNALRDNSAVFGRQGVEALLTSPRFAHSRIVVSIASHHPVPSEFGSLLLEHPERLSVWYRNPRHSNRAEPWDPAKGLDKRS